MKKILLIINLLGLFSTAAGASSMGLGGLEGNPASAGVDQKAAASGEQSAKYNQQALRDIKKFIDRRVDELDHSPSQQEKAALAILVRKNLIGMQVTDEKIIQEALAYLDRAKPLSERLAAIRGMGPVAKAIGEGVIGAAAPKKAVEEEAAEVAPQKPESLMPWLMSLFGWQKRNDYRYRYAGWYNSNVSSDGKVLVTYYPVAGGDPIVILNFDDATGSWQQKHTFIVHGHVHSLAINHDGSILVIGMSVGTARVYRRQPDGSYTQDATILQGENVAIDALGNRIVTGRFAVGGSTINTYHFAQGAWQQENNTIVGQGYRFDLSANGLFLITWGGDYYAYEKGQWVLKRSFGQSNVNYMDYQGSKLLISRLNVWGRRGRGLHPILYEHQSSGTWKDVLLSKIPLRAGISSDGALALHREGNIISFYTLENDTMPIMHTTRILKEFTFSPEIRNYFLSADNRRLVAVRVTEYPGDSIVETHDANLTLEQQKAIVRNAALTNLLHDLYELKHNKQKNESVVLTLAQEDILAALPENLRKALYHENKLLPASAGAEYARKRKILEHAREQKTKKEREGKRSDTKRGHAQQPVYPLPPLPQTITPRPVQQIALGDIKRKVQAQPQQPIYPLPPLPQQPVYPLPPIPQKTKAEQLREQKEKAAKAKKLKSKQAQERKRLAEQNKAYQARKKKEQEERKKGLDLKRKQDLKRKEEAKKKKELEERKKAAARKRIEQALKKKRMEQARLQKARQDRIKRQQMKKKREEAIKKRKQMMQKKVQKARLQRAYFDDEQMTMKRFGYRPKAEL